MNKAKEPLVVHDRQTLARVEKNAGTVGLMAVSYTHLTLPTILLV